MIKKQKELWPNECPCELTNLPLCFNASENLGNEMHRDKDAARSFAVWVNKEGDVSSKSWYLLFPEWEVCIEIINGTWISWDGQICGHCSAMPNVGTDDRLLSLFCSLSQNLCNYLEKSNNM